MYLLIPLPNEPLLNVFIVYFVYEYIFNYYNEGFEDDDKLLGNEELELLFVGLVPELGVGWPPVTWVNCRCNATARCA